MTTSASPIASRSSSASLGRSLFMVCQKNGSMLSKPSLTSSRTEAAGLGDPARTIVPIRTSRSSLILAYLKFRSRRAGPFRRSLSRRKPWRDCGCCRGRRSPAPSPREPPQRSRGGPRNARRCGRPRRAPAVRPAHRVEQPVALAGSESLDADRVGAVPEKRAFCSHKTPHGLPRGWQPLRAPTAAIDEDRARLELEDGRGRRSCPVPGMTGVPFAAIDARGHKSRHAAQSVESMDRHVQEQDMLHLLAESAEMRGEEEIGVNAGDVADRAALERARDAADAGRHNGGSAPPRESVLPIARARRDRALRQASPPLAFRSAHGSPAASPAATTSWRADGTTTSNSKSGWDWSISS